MALAAIMTILQAIADFEGFNKAGSRAQRNNNPGNIEYGTLAESFGAVLETIPEGIMERARFAYFPDVNSGFSCLRELLNKDYVGMSLIAAFNKYAPPVENNTNEYANIVAQQTGLTLETILDAENIV
jgi:hypothetical protein